MDGEASEVGLTPIEMVAREMAFLSSLSREEIISALQRVLMLLMGRALGSLEEGSDDSLKMCHEYLVTSEIVVAFGTTLRALEDIERYELRRAVT